MNQEIINIVVAVTSIAGVILAIYSILLNKRRDKTVIEIIPQAYMGRMINSTAGKYGSLLAHNDFNPNAEYFAFTVINKSFFPVIINELGFELKGKGKMIVPIPIEESGTGFPSELSAKSSKVFFTLSKLLIIMAKEREVGRVYVKTACDEVFYGRSLALRKLKKYAKQL